MNCSCIEKKSLSVFHRSLTTEPARLMCFSSYLGLNVIIILVFITP